MKTIRLEAIFLVAAAAFFSCKNELPPLPVIPSPPCSDSVHLGVFVTEDAASTELFPWQGYNLMCSNPQVFSGVSVNYPGVPEWLGVALQDTLTGSSDCLTTGQETQYHWQVAREKGLTTLAATHGNKSWSKHLYVLVMETPLLPADQPEHGPAGYYRVFTQMEKPPSTVVYPPFMTIMTEEKLPGQGAAFEQGYEYMPSVVLNGKTVYAVYTNTEPLPGSIPQIFYSLENGVVGFIDDEGNEYVR